MNMDLQGNSSRAYSQYTHPPQIYMHSSGVRHVALTSQSKGGLGLGSTPVIPSHPAAFVSVFSKTAKGGSLGGGVNGSAVTGIKGNQEIGGVEHGSVGQMGALSTYQHPSKDMKAIIDMAGTAAGGVGRAVVSPSILMEDEGPGSVALLFLTGSNSRKLACYVNLLWSERMYMYIYMYIYVCIYICINLYIYIYIYMYMCKYIYMCIYMYESIHIYTCMHVCIYINL